MQKGASRRAQHLPTFSDDSHSPPSHSHVAPTVSLSSVSSRCFSAQFTLRMPSLGVSLIHLCKNIYLLCHTSHVLLSLTLQCHAVTASTFCQRAVTGAMRSRMSPAGISPMVPCWALVAWVRVEWAFLCGRRRERDGFE